MLVFHLPIARFLSYGITPRPMAGPVGRCDGMLQFTWPDIEKSRAEARRLLKEAGAEGLSIELLSRNVDQPFKYVATWLIDEWS